MYVGETGISEFEVDNRGLNETELVFYCKLAHHNYRVYVNPTELYRNQLANLPDEIRHTLLRQFNVFHQKVEQILTNALNSQE